MTFDISKTWCRKAGAREDGFDVGAGFIAADPMFTHEGGGAEESSEASRLALGRFINLMRRDHGLSIEALAEKADIEIGDLLCLENNAAHLPDVRTLYQLSEVFGVSQEKLMGLSGLTHAIDDDYVEEAVRYAAKSASVEVLTEDERAILNGLISVLSESTEHK
ncbi:helix-turn-helix domain-containing protein [Leisingera caerulea]|uniref:Helix-turn-helix domain-containing protein n=1 Tax=Leisingera caerulea TaxID=506591 RepID=A0ABY5WSI9_LEICA|nr:helix-turn-helix transcriptional regulator [Leisingera caerulea]UWQ57292.1 helix-turn-helix domain-containing protein [Leisingera caerulea]